MRRKNGKLFSIIFPCLFSDFAWRHKETWDIVNIKQFKDFMAVVDKRRRRRIIKINDLFFQQWTFQSFISFNDDDENF